MVLLLHEITQGKVNKPDITRQAGKTASFVQ